MLREKKNMSSSIAAFALRRGIRPMIKPRHFSFLASSLAAPRVLAPKTLTLSRILFPISVPFASTKAVNPVDKIRRSDGDENLLRVLEDEIEFFQEADEQAPLEVELPEDFPFEIIDNPRYQSIMLNREFQGQTIKVFTYLFTPYMDVGSKQDASDGDADEESEQDATEGVNTDDDRHLHISLSVVIDPVFSCRFHMDAGDCKLDRVEMKWHRDSDAEKAYKGSVFWANTRWNEGFQRALIEYAEVRGIKVSLYKFLREYLMTMYDRKYIAWLKNLKEFVEK